MPRLKKPHRFEVIELPCDPSVPLERRRALYTRLSDDDLEKVSHTSQQADVQAEFGLTQELPLPPEGTSPTSSGYRGRDRGYVITMIIRDWRTGADPKRRGFRELINAAHAGKHGGVLFRDDDRLFRDVIGGWPLVQLHEELPSYTFEAARGHFSIEDFATHAAFSGRERAKTRQRTMAGRAMRARNGEAVHTKFPYWLARMDNGRADLVPERAEAMRQAIRMYAAGMRLGLVAAWMKDSAPVGGESATWSSDRLREAFRSPALWGRLDYGRHKIVIQKRGDDVVVIGRTVNRNAIPFEVPALIHRTELERVACSGCERDDLPSWERLDEMIKASNLRTGGRPATRQHPLRRRVVCPCGWRMAYAPKWLPKSGEQEYGYLTCARTKQRGTSVVGDYPPCELGTVRTRQVWPTVMELFIEATKNPDKVIAQVEADILAAAATEARTQAEDDATVARATEALTELAASENRLYERWDAKQISQAVYEGQSARIATQRRAYEEAMRQVLDRRQILENAAGATASLREGLAEAAELPFDSVSLEHWTRLFAGLVKDVELSADGVPTIRWRRE